MKYIKIHIVFCFLLISCTSNTILKKPNDLIPQDKMEDLLTDMFIAAGAKRTVNKAGDRDVNYYSFIFKKYNVDSAQFKRSNYYYTSKIDAYDDILKEVEKRLRAKKDSINHILHEKDSLNNIKMDEKMILKRNKEILSTYDSILKNIDVATVSILKENPVFSPLLIPSEKEIKQNKIVHFFTRIEKEKLAKQKHKTYTNTIAILENLNKTLEGRPYEEVLDYIRTQKDSVRYVLKEIQKDSVLYFPIQKEQSKSPTILGKNNIEAKNKIAILKQLKRYFESKKQKAQHIIKNQNTLNSDSVEIPENEMLEEQLIK